MKRIQLALQYNFWSPTSVWRWVQITGRWTRQRFWKQASAFCGNTTKCPYGHRWGQMWFLLLLFQIQTCCSGEKFTCLFNSAGRRDPNRLEADVSFKWRIQVGTILAFDFSALRCFFFSRYLSLCATDFEGGGCWYKTNSVGLKNVYLRKNTFLYLLHVHKMQINLCTIALKMLCTFSISKSDRSYVIHWFSQYFKDSSSSYSSSFW